MQNNNLAILQGTCIPEILAPTTLTALLQEAFIMHANNKAIVFENTSFTYADIDNWSNACAADIIAKGAQVGDCIGVWYPRSVQLHIAILGILKAGCTYMPFDDEMPADRVQGVLQDVQAKFCFTKNTLTIPCYTLEVVALPTEKISLPSISITPKQPAYILFTSGSTGKPKGIPISQFQIAHLVQAEQHILQIKPTDKVYQGFSVSFDMWCEETFISFFAGACIYVATATNAKAIDEVGAMLNKLKITVLHAVPSLLAVIEESIPTLRIVNAGGEACTTPVLQKWSTPNITFYNSYGPTETTVTSSMIALQPNDSITIGHPLPNYYYAIVDETNNIVPQGVQGELIITGAGVGKQYLHLPELTTQKFIPNHLQANGLQGDTIYKTGDDAIINADGTVTYIGRQDDQVKIRGYRIELGEIENQLAKCTGVNTCAIKVQKDQLLQDHLIGYVVPNKNETIIQENIQHQLQKVLAPYMMPKEIIVLDEMPRLPSGKINRKLLPIPTAFTVPMDNSTFTFDANTSIKEKVLKTLHHFFSDIDIDESKDFFTDLNGHSLLAASFVSRLRKDAGITHASLRDVYAQRPLRNLIAEWEKDQVVSTAEKTAFQPISKMRHRLCWLAQTFALFIIYGLFASQIYLPYLGYYYVQTETESHTLGVLASIGLFCLVPPALSLVSIITKWILIGRYKAGEYPLWGKYYFKWWFVEKLESLVQINFLNGTPIYRAYLRLKGCAIGADAQFGPLQMQAEDLIEIGANVSISSGVLFNNVVVEDGLVKFTEIKIGNHAYVGSNCIINGNTVIEDWGELKDLSLMQSGTTIQKGEVWGGSPCAKVGNKEAAEMQAPPTTPQWKKNYYYARFSALLIIFPVAILLPLVPVITAVTELDNAADDYDFSYFVWIPILSLLYMTLFALQTIIVNKILTRNIKPGIYSIYSPTYFKKWLSDQFLTLSLIIMHPLFATVYVSAFFRALGAKIGKYTEISTANNVSHVLLEIGDNSFIADNVNLGESDVRNQTLILEKTKIGNKTFVGNSAHVPQGYTLGNDMLIGVLSLPPTPEQLQANDSKDWFGSPAVALPRRQDSGTYDSTLTHRPSKRVWLARATIELIRIILPETILLMASFLFIAYVHDVLMENTWWQFILLYPIYFFVFIAFPCFAITVILKWLVVGKYKPASWPMWNYKVWCSEAITSVYESVAVPFFLEHLKGTPWLPICLRAFGVKTGKRIYLDTTDFTEHDLTSIADEAMLNADCGPQTHLFEDRVMKMGTIHIGKRTKIGAGTIILYDTVIGDEVKIESLSLVMKGEHLMDSTNWKGNPLR
jgi:non-ribosomal peptide synthetase-like protein